MASVVDGVFEVKRELIHAQQIMLYAAQQRHKEVAGELKEQSEYLDVSQTVVEGLHDAKECDVP